MLIELNYRQTRRCDLTLLPQQFWHCQKDAYTHLINLGYFNYLQKKHRLRIFPENLFWIVVLSNSIFNCIARVANSILFKIILCKDWNCHVINCRIMEIKQLELIDHWIKVYVNQTNQCSHGIEIFDHSNSKKKHPLGFSNLGGVFILFLLGISVSTLMFLSEVCFPKNWNQQYSRMDNVNNYVQKVLVAISNFIRVTCQTK